MSIRPTRFDCPPLEETPPGEEFPKQHKLAVLTSILTEKSKNAFTHLHRVATPSLMSHALYERLEQESFSEPIFMTAQPALQTLAWKRPVAPLASRSFMMNLHEQPADTIYMRINPKKEIALPTTGTAKPYRLETSSGSSVWHQANIRPNAQLQICVHQTDGSCTPIPIPQEVRQRLLTFMRNDGPPGRCCAYFVNEVHGKPQPESSSCAFEKNDWNFLPLGKETRLEPGDCVHLSDKPGLDHLSRTHSASIGHFAICLADDLFVSIYGNNGPLQVTDLESMKKFYKAQYIYKLTPK